MTVSSRAMRSISTSATGGGSARCQQPLSPFQLPGRQLLESLQLAPRLSHLRDVDPLVVRRYFAYVQPLFSSPMRLAMALHIVEPDLVDFMLAVNEGNGTDRDTGRPHVDQQERDSGLRTRFAVRAHQAENPVGEVPQRVSRSSAR